MHLLIAFAGSADPYAQRLLQTLHLPHLQRALDTRVAQALDMGTEQDFCTPHERVLLKTLGSHAKEPPQARITPCHWQVGQGEVIMGQPEELALSEQESRALMGAMQPYFLEDGIKLTYEAPLRWQAQGELFRGLPTACLDRVVGHNIDDWLTHSAQARPLHRLQNEMQMLLYTHPCNDARNERGLKAVNSFWVSETAPYQFSADDLEKNGIRLVRDLAAPALAQDWVAWGEAWQKLDAELLVLHAQLQNITLCGARHAQTWRLDPPTVWQKVVRRFKPTPISRILSAL